jgi:IclR family transcriptional regulator, acetate operon repressor
MQLQEIAARIKLHTSTAHRVLATLVAEGLVEHGSDHRYCLSLEVFAIGAGFLRRSAIRRAALPVLMRLAKEITASVNLAFWSHGKVIVVDCIPMPDMYSFFTETGSIVPAHATGIGKAILAFRTKEAIREIGPLQRFTDHTICNHTDLASELEKTRKRGYAIDNEETIPGCRCVAAPILQSSKKGVVAAISISATPSIVSPDRIPCLATQVKQACLQVAIQAGYRPPESLLRD